MRRKGESLLTLESDYTVIDIETTGLSSRYDEIIELSAIRVKDNQIAEEFTSLVKPDGEISGFITQLTGITDEMVESALKIRDVIKDYVDFIGDSLLLGHNIHFDLNFIYDNYMACFGGHFNNDFIDTMRLARNVLPELGNHKLGTLASHYGMETDGAHRGLVDCRMTHGVYAKLKDHVVSNDIDLDVFTVQKKYPPYQNLTKISVTVETFDEDHPLHGKSVVFTGELEKMNRVDAAQMVANLGGIPQNGVNKKTDFLILGNNDYNNAIKGGKSSKQRKAEEYILNGQDLQIISETEFYEMLGLEQFVYESPYEEAPSRILKVSVDCSPFSELFSEIKTLIDKTFGRYDELSFEEPIVVEIDYCDNNGEVTRHNVNITYIIKIYDGDYGIFGFYHSRDESKVRFVLSQIQKTIVNGQEVDIVRHIVDTFRHSAQYKYRMLYRKPDDDVGAAARILAYIVKVNGIFSRKKKIAVSRYIQGIAGADTGMDLEDYVNGFKDFWQAAEEYKETVEKANISQSLLDKALELVDKDPIRQEAYEMLLATFNKQKGTEFYKENRYEPAE